MNAMEMKKEIAAIRKKIIADPRCNTEKPVYIFDQNELIKSAKDFTKAFKENGLQVHPYYALKSNPYPKIVSTLAKLNIGVDVSSEHELLIAKKAKAKKIIVTGPGKTEVFFQAIKKTSAVQIVYLESIQELLSFKKVFKNSKPPFLVGVRIVPTAYASWDKFGISLNELSSFLKLALKHCVLIEAIQFHISYVKDKKTHAKALRELAAVGEKLKKHEGNVIKVIDIGGGFSPQTIEGDYPWNPKGFSLFDIDPIKAKILNLTKGKRAKFSKPDTLSSMAKEIALVWFSKIQKYFPTAKLCAEPGRYLSHRCMHILLKIVDKKSPTTVILNGGWNMLGWEKYQYISYVPVFNIDNFSLTREQPCILYGNLCLPDDIWGYYLFGSKIQIGDRILIPFQGAYTYTYRQEFIRGIPNVIDWQGASR